VTIRAARIPPEDRARRLARLAEITLDVDVGAEERVSSVPSRWTGTVSNARRMLGPELAAIADDLRRLAGEIAWPLGAARVRVLAEELAVLAVRIEDEERK
jgi:hypothetical protein